MGTPFESKLWYKVPVGLYCHKCKYYVFPELNNVCRSLIMTREQNQFLLMTGEQIIFLWREPERWNYITPGSTAGQY